MGAHKRAQKFVKMKEMLGLFLYPAMKSILVSTNLRQQNVAIKIQKARKKYDENVRLININSNV